MAMRRILLATDLSSRADRAMRRAAIAAAAAGAELFLLFVVDDDQPRSLIEAGRREAGALLARAAEGLPELRAASARPLVEEGDPFDVILRVAEERDCDLVVLGEHRRRLLRDMLVGTTVERVIRLSRRPVLMVNALPDGAYRRVLMTTDLSAVSGRALQAAAGTGLFAGGTVTVLHAREVPGLGAMAMADLPAASVAGHVEEGRREARADLQRFLAGLDLPGLGRPELMVDTQPPAYAILDAVDRLRPDLLVLGTGGAGGVGRMVLGSVAAEVVRRVACDTLTVPAAD
jgi:nucleotide-binding universal stress UspA family protein